jgi:hypothetical protein
MAKWKLGEKTEARRWYAKAVAQMGNTGPPESLDLPGIHAEAENLIDK